MSVAAGPKEPHADIERGDIDSTSAYSHNLKELLVLLRNSLEGR